MTIQSLKEKKQEEYRLFVDTLSSDVVRTFPQSTCQSKNLVQGAKVSYKKQNNVLTVSLKPDGEDNAAEFRFNELTGDSLNAICDKSGKCEEFLTSDIGQVHQAKQKLMAKSNLEIDEKSAKLKTKLDSLRNEFETNRNEGRRKLMTVEKFIADNNISYPKATPIGELVKKMLDPKAVEEIRKKYVENKYRDIQNRATGKTGEKLIAFWNKIEFDHSDAADKEKFSDYVKRVTESCITGKNWCEDKDYNLASAIQQKFNKLLTENQPILFDERSSHIYKSNSVYMLSPDDLKKFEKALTEEDSKLYEDRHKKDTAFRARLNAIIGETGLNQKQMAFCQQSTNYRSRSSENSEAQFDIASCAISYMANVESSKRSDHIDISRLASSLKDFGACCSNADCNASVGQKRISLNKAQQEMTRRGAR